MSNLNSMEATKWNEKTKPIMLTAFGSQIGHKPCRSLAHLPTACYKRLPQTDQNIVSLYVQLLLALTTGDISCCKHVVLQAAHDLRERSGAPNNARQNIFFSIGGQELLIRFLLYPFESYLSKSGSSESTEQMDIIRKVCLDLLGDLYFSVTEFPNILADDEAVLIRCFWFMENTVTFDAAITLVEYALLQRLEQRKIFDLRRIPNIMKLVSRFSTRQFFLFSRITGVLTEISKKIAKSGIATEEAESIIATSNERIIEAVSLTCERFLKFRIEGPDQPPRRSQITPYGRPQVNLSMILAIITLFICERTDTTFWFWFGDILEAFLSESGIQEQELIASSGLMEHLVWVFLRQTFIYTSCLQTDLNILGELIKNHAPLREKLNNLLDGDKFHQFCDVISSSLLVRSQYVQSFIEDYKSKH